MIYFRKERAQRLLQIVPIVRLISFVLCVFCLFCIVLVALGIGIWVGLDEFVLYTMTASFCVYVK